MQSVSSRIWTRVAVSISYDDNHYTIRVIQQYLKSFNCRYKMRLGLFKGVIDKMCFKIIYIQYV